MAEQPFEVRNRYGDVVQRGAWVEVEPEDPSIVSQWKPNVEVWLRDGDTINYPVVRLSSD